VFVPAVTADLEKIVCPSALVNVTVFVLPTVEDTTTPRISPRMTYEAVPACVPPFVTAAPVVIVTSSTPARAIGDRANTARTAMHTNPKRWLHVVFIV
jgi:hypothetical protein